MSRKEPINEAFQREQDYAYAEEAARDAFEVDWVTAGCVLATLERFQTEGDAGWAGEIGTRTNIGPKSIRVVFGDYDVYLASIGVTPTPDAVLSTALTAIIVYDVEVEPSDLLLVESGDSPHVGKRFRVERVRYFPRSRRSVCTAELVKA